MVKRITKSGARGEGGGGSEGSERAVSVSGARKSKSKR